jgi:PAS domain S-box-containing protein
MPYRYLEGLSKEELAARLKELLEKEKAREVTERLQHELHVHQVELEMQNRQLQETQFELEASHARYVDLFDFAPVAYLTLGPEAVVLEVNLAGAELLGYERARLKDVPLFAMVIMASPSGFWDSLRRCAVEGCAVSTELAFSTRRGPVEAMAIVAPILRPDGSVSAYRLAMLDIGDRKKAEREREAFYRREQELRRQVEELVSANVALAEVIATSDSPTEAVLRVITERARAVVGAEYAALGATKGLGEPFDPWVYTGVDERVPAAVGRTPRAVGMLGAVVQAHTVLRVGNVRAAPAFRGFPPGHPEMTSFMGMPVDYGDRTFGILYVANKRGSSEFSADDERTLGLFAEQAAVSFEIARLREAAEEAIHSRDLVLSIVAHDLRDRLSATLLSCAMMARSSTHDRRKVEIIRQSAEDMGRIISDLLTATTIESGKLVVNPQRISVASLVEQVGQVLEPVVSCKGLKLEIQIAPDLPQAYCDRSRTLQVLWNLVGNAIKFSSPGQPIRIGAQAKEHEVVVSVSDEGPGIAPDKIPHLFERYWRGDPSRSGVGLGLYIARGIVEASGGRMWVESEVGRGATFSFTLPTLLPPG